MPSARTNTYEFAIINTGTLVTDAGLLDFCRMDISNYGGGEGLDLLWGYISAPLVGGEFKQRLTLASSNPTYTEPRFQCVVDLPVAASTIIALQFDMDFDKFQVYVNGELIVQSNMSSIWSSPAYATAEFGFILYSGSQMYFDEYRKSNQVLYTADVYDSNSVSPPNPVFPGYVTGPTNVVIRTDDVDMTYHSVYAAYTPGATAVGGIYDQTQLPSTGTMSALQNMLFSATTSGTVIGTIQMNYPDKKYWEYTIPRLAPNEGFHIGLGIFAQAYGPPFNPNYGDGGGGPLPTWYRSDGYTYGYGDGSPGNSAPFFGIDDIIGVICDTTASQCHFFKNGVHIGDANLANNTGVYAMASVFKPGF